MLATLEDPPSCGAASAPPADRPPTDRQLNHTHRLNCSKIMFFGRKVRIVYLLVRTLLRLKRAIGSSPYNSSAGSGCAQAEAGQVVRIGLGHRKAEQQSLRTQLT
jgi:hypothetical protein